MSVEFSISSRPGAKNRRRVICVLAVGLLAHLPICTANATSLPARMPTGGPAPMPMGHIVFCKRVPSECTQKANSPKPLKLTRELWAKLVNVNNEVNMSVIPKTDQEVWGVRDYWTYPGIYGDCEDYAIEKQRRLIDLGFPRQNLLITAVEQPSGEGHAVLTINTNFGDYVLDNLQGKILLWNETSYRFIERQSAADSGKWIAIDDPRKPVGSLPDRDRKLVMSNLAHRTQPDL
jgi:predicted transglutaminase-like cysteine proteinase